MVSTHFAPLRQGDNAHKSDDPEQNIPAVTEKEIDYCDQGCQIMTKQPIGKSKATPDKYQNAIGCYYILIPKIHTV